MSAAEVRREDQVLINEFGRLNAHARELREERALLQKRLEEVDDATTELVMGDGDDVCIPRRAAAPATRGARAQVQLMLGGEAFVDVSEDVATAHCEAEQAAVQAELDALDERVGAMEARQKELKGVLYGRFGSQINLEE